MRSPTHRTVLLDAAFERVAIGASTDEQGRVAFAQVFRATACAATTQACVAHLVLAPSF